jgi:hypothetical protein
MSTGSYAADSTGRRAQTCAISKTKTSRARNFLYPLPDKDLPRSCGRPKHEFFDTNVSNGPKVEEQISSGGSPSRLGAT